MANMEPAKKKIIYTYTSRSSFVRNDIESLRSTYDVIEYRFDVTNKKLTPLQLVKQLFFLLFNLGSAHGTISMFGGYHSFLPAFIGKIFRKPSLIILAGTDCVSFPSIGYGNFAKKFLGMFSRWSYRYATHLAPVHNSLVLADYTYQDKDHPQQGYKYFCPGIATPHTVIEYGFDASRWYVPGNAKLKNSFITVAAGLAMPSRAALKGVDLILAAAEHFPQATFTIIGCPEDHQLPVRSANIRTYSFVSNEELQRLYNEHEFYVQVSMSEGFPNAICEAMTCKCIPVGSNVGGLPDIIGDTGFILERRDAGKFRELLQQALSADRTTLAEKARQRIITHFPKDLREVKLVELLKKLGI